MDARWKLAGCSCHALFLFQLLLFLAESQVQESVFLYLVCPCGSVLGLDIWTVLYKLGVLALLVL